MSVPENVYYPPTTIPAEPGFFIAEFGFGDDQYPDKFPDDFTYTPIIAWLIQPSCSDTQTILRGRRGENEVLPCDVVHVTPITVHGYWDWLCNWDDTIRRAGTNIKHPDGTFSVLGDSETKYKDEAAALVGVAKRVRHLARLAEQHQQREREKAEASAIAKKAAANQPVSIDEVRFAAKRVLKAKPLYGRKALVSILAEHSAPTITALDPANYTEVTRKLFEKVPA